MARRAAAASWIALAAVLCAIPFVAGKFAPYLLMRVMMMGIFALGYNLLLGRTGLLSFGHGAFYAAGAYGLGLFSLHVSPHPLLGLAAGVAAASILALGIGFLCVRSSEVYFSMLTLAFGMMFFALVWNAREVTGGDDGLIGVMRAPIDLGLVRIPIARESQLYFLVLSLFGLSVWIVHRIRASPFGLVLAGIRENATRSAFAGVPVRRYRLWAFVVSAAFAGLAGALEVLLESGHDPSWRTGPTRPSPSWCRSSAGSTRSPGRWWGACSSSPCGRSSSASPRTGCWPSASCCWW
jgi:branched-chain amino acid transport system permease protein